MTIPSYQRSTQKRVFGGATLRNAALGQLLLQIDGEAACRWRTAGHVFVPPAEAEAREADAEGEAAETEAESEEQVVVVQAVAVEDESELASVQVVHGTPVGAPVPATAPSSPVELEAAPAVAASSLAAPQLVLYSVGKVHGGQRAVLHVLDARNDLQSLSSRAVTQCVWAANVPAALLGTTHAGANRACCALRNALDPSKAAQGNNGVNMKVYLCLNAEGKAVTLKSVLDKGTLARYLRA